MVHTRKACEKARSTATRIGRLLTNVGGPKSSKRRVLAGVVSSVALYAAPVWAPKAQECAAFRQEMDKAQRAVVLGACSAYRTVSTVAAQVLAGVPPLDLLARERTEVRNGIAKEAARERLLRRWQERWRTSEQGEWTRRLIPDIHPWLERKKGEVDHWVTQILTGHGAFNTYLNRIGKRTSGRCGTCPEEADSPEHVVFQCPRWSQPRTTCYGATGTLTPENLVPTMLENEGNWSAVSRLAHLILAEKTTDMPPRHPNVGRH